MPPSCLTSPGIRCPVSHTSPLPLILSLPLAVGTGLSIPVQGRINGALGVALDDGLAAAVVSFTMGLAGDGGGISLVLPGGRAGLARHCPCPPGTAVFRAGTCWPGAWAPSWCFAGPYRFADRHRPVHRGHRRRHFAQRPAGGPDGDGTRRDGRRSPRGGSPARRSPWSRSSGRRRRSSWSGSGGLWLLLVLLPWRPASCAVSSRR